MTERRNPLSGPVPGDAERQLFAQARAALEANNPAAALPVLEKLFATFPGDVEIAVMFAGVLLAQGHLRRATQCLLDTLSAMPPLPELNARVAKYLHRLGESRGARDCLQQKVLEVPRAAPGLAAMGMMWQTLGVPERALEKFDRAQSFGFDAPAQQYYRGLQLQFMGRSDEACDAWRRCLDKSPGFGRACLSWTRSAGKSHQEALLERADAGLAQAEPDSVDKAAFEFARFHLFESANRPDAAWIALREGNAIMAQRLKHDPACIDHLIGATIAWCDAAFLRAEQSALSAGPQPIFILGMPRSGTTLLERVLGNHTQVVSAGELNDFWQQMRWLTDLPGRQMLDDALLQRLHAINYTELAERYLAQARWR
ncbi:MAG TPA: sulfotransferase, partial [Rudaea sp.]|nr:sulfotransferase [Rudaea sp.]